MDPQVKYTKTAETPAPSISSTSGVVSKLSIYNQAYSSLFKLAIDPCVSTVSETTPVVVNFNAATDGVSGEATLTTGTGKIVKFSSSHAAT